MIGEDRRERFKLAVIVPNDQTNDPIVSELCFLMADESYGMIILAETLYTEQDLSFFSKTRNKVMPLDTIDILAGYITFFTYKTSNRGMRTTRTINSIPVKTSERSTILELYKKLVFEATTQQPYEESQYDQKESKERY